MPIAALPQNSVRALGSSQVLTDSASLVKELIDNAIDGRATTISVDISLNTLDDIRVKDNGHGIAPLDRSLACTMHCTSKIRDLVDLRDIGGRSLGFRGVALASAAEMSRCLTISTRIEGEATASELTFGRQGQIASEKRTSLPVGTTVRVDRFLETLPVRRQAAEKASVKTLAKIKRVLQAYALARPSLRLSLKVLKAKNEKAKNEKANWKYPKNTGVGNSRNSASYFSAAIDVIGKNVTDQCQWISSTWSSAGEQIDTALGAQDVVAATDSFTFDTVLATPGCDASIISNNGQYLSVDSRPVSRAKGTMKEVISIYKSYLRSANSSEDDSKITDPFLCMNIACPRRSYDVNVEPAKDDLLFTNAELLICLAEKCFEIVYGKLKKSLPQANVHKTTTKPSGIGIMLARKDPPTLRETSAPRPLSEKARGHSQQIATSQLPAMSKPSRNITSSTPSGPSGSVSAADNDNGPDDHSMDDRSNLICRISGSSPDVSGGIADNTASRHKAPAWKSSMCADGDDEDKDDQLYESPNSLAESAIEEEAEEEDNLKSVHVSNPWAFAKLNAPFRPPARTDQGQTFDPGSNNQLLTPARQTGDAGNALESLLGTSALGRSTIGRSQHRTGNDPTLSSPSPFPFPLKARGRRKVDEAISTFVPLGQERYGRGPLDPWVRKSLGSNSENIDASDDEENIRGDHGPPDIDVAYPGPFVSARSLPKGTPLCDIPAVRERPRRKVALQQHRETDQPYISSVNDPERVWFETGESQKQKPQQQPRQRQRQQNGNALMLRDDEDTTLISETSPLPTPPLHPDLALTMDYEARKQLATQEHRKSLRQQARQNATDDRTPTGPFKSSPHKNRQNAAIAALHTKTNHASPSDPPAFEADDPRAYLIRSKQSEDSDMHKPPANRKANRRKTTMLPFETLHEDTYTGDLIHIIKTANIDFHSLLRQNWDYDEYISDGVIGSSAFSRSAMVTEEEVGGWERKVKALTKMQYRLEGMTVEEEMEGELELDLWSLLRGGEENGASA